MRLANRTFTVITFGGRSQIDDRISAGSFSVSEFGGGGIMPFSMQ